MQHNTHEGILNQMQSVTTTTADKCCSLMHGTHHCTCKGALQPSMALLTCCHKHCQGHLLLLLRCGTLTWLASQGILSPLCSDKQLWHQKPLKSQPASGSVQW